MGYRVGCNIVHHHGVVDLPANARCCDFVDLAHSLPATTQVLYLGLWQLLQFCLADVVTSLNAVAWRPSEAISVDSDQLTMREECFEVSLDRIKVIYWEFYTSITDINFT